MTRVILASASKTRQAMLTQAGVVCEAIPAPIDEASFKAGLKAEGATVQQAADTLAEMKAIRLTRKYPNDIIIAADQMLECEGVWFDKPADRDHARAHLQALRNKTHHLVSAAVVFKGSGRIWGQTDVAELEMRDFTDAFLDEYLDAVGDDVLSSVGAYQLEGRGAQLFKRVNGDFFTVLGLPLLPLLGFLRNHGVLTT